MTTADMALAPLKFEKNKNDGNSAVERLRVLISEYQDPFALQGENLNSSEYISAIEMTQHSKRHRTFLLHSLENLHF